MVTPTRPRPPDRPLVDHRLPPVDDAVGAVGAVRHRRRGRTPGRARRAWPELDSRVALAVAAAVVVIYALVAAWWTPRGPLTNTQALGAIALALAAGGVAGRLTATRWAAVLAPLGFAVVFELARLGVDGPTVDAIRPFTTYGFIAFLTGRVFHALLALLPLAVGASLGAAAARRAQGVRGRRRGWRRAGTYGGRAVALLGVVAVVAVTAGVARPARTAPITGPDGEPLAGSVAELTYVSTGGHDLHVMIRGASTADPVLLFLAGGPGGSELGAMRRHGQALEDDFVVATFDQRGTGRSAGALDPTGTMTLDAAVDDVVAVTEHLQDRFGDEPVVLVGNSWGTILGVRAVQRRPDLYRAFVGAGQMVSPTETDRIFYDDTLAWARRTGRDDLVERLADIGPPPYDEIARYETVMAHEHDVYRYDRRPNAEGEGGFSENLGVEEYSLPEQVRTLGAVLDVYATLYPRIQDVDLRVDAQRLEVPVTLVQGRFEARGRAEPAAQWFRLLDAPAKRLVTFDTSGHRPLFEQPDRFHQVMLEVLAATGDGGGR